MAGAVRFEDLDIYKLAVQLRREIVRLSARGAVARDFKFVNQIRDAARGGPRNIAEGFSRFVPSEIFQFLSYAKASIDETKDHIYDGHESGYFSDDECDVLLKLVRRTNKGICRMMSYLDSPDAARAYQQLRLRRRRAPHIKPQTREDPHSGESSENLMTTTDDERREVRPPENCDKRRR
jgi:four helix bundle protein